MIYNIISLKYSVVFGLVICWVQCNELCDFDNEKCITQAARNIFSNLLSGVEGIIDPLEPLTIPRVNGAMPGFTYELTNATFTSLKTCVPNERVNKAESSYDYVLRCSQLVLNAAVTAEGYIGPIYIDGSDTVTITADDYVIRVRGYLGIFIAEKDQSSHFYLKDFIMDTEPQGKISFKSNNAFGITSFQASLADTFFKNNWKILEKMLRYPTMNIFTSTIINKIDTYLKFIPIVNIIPKKDDVQEIDVFL